MEAGGETMTTESLVLKEPVFVGEQGNPVAVLVPIDLYRSWQHQLKIGTDPSGSAEREGSPGGFKREKAAFERMKPDLMEKYPGKCVALVRGEVVEVGDDKIEVIERVRERFGNVSMYVQWVTDRPRVYHLPLLHRSEWPRLDV
jgi:hypothetical protein